MLVDYMLFSLPKTAASLTVTEHYFSLISVANTLWCLFFSIYGCKVTAKLSLVKSFCAKFSKQLVDLTIIVAKCKRQPPNGQSFGFHHPENPLFVRLRATGLSRCCHIVTWWMPVETLRISTSSEQR